MCMCFIRGACKLKATKLLCTAASYSSMFEQPDFLKHCSATPHITADSKQRWSSLWKISHLCSGAAEKHDNNYAAAQIHNEQMIFKFLFLPSFKRENFNYTCSTNFCPGNSLQRTERGMVLGITLLNCE